MGGGLKKEAGPKTATYPQEARGEHPPVELCFSESDPPRAIAALPEPLRAVALEQANRLVAEGHPPDEAVRRAVQQAHELGADRVKGS